MSESYRDFVNAGNVRTQQLEIGYFRQTTGITDNFPITAAMPSRIYIKATAARDVLLPAVTADLDGRVLSIHNEGTGVITLKTSSDAALSPALTIVGSASRTVSAIFGLAAASAWKVVAKSS